VDLLFRVFEALDAAFFPVIFLLAMCFSYLLWFLSGIGARNFVE
jgi:hypothetical protein